jgi:hypothetical protein
MRVTSGQIDRLIRSMSPFCREGRWTMPECALAADVVHDYIMEIIATAKTRYANGSRRVILHQAELHAVGMWAGFLGLAQDILERVFDDIGIERAPEIKPVPKAKPVLKVKPAKVRLPKIVKLPAPKKWETALRFLAEPATLKQFRDKFGNSGTLSYLISLGKIKSFDVPNAYTGRHQRRRIKRYVAVEAKSQEQTQ